MQNNTIQGHCLCGAIKYSATQPPLWIAHCHCSSCRRNTGSAVATFIAFTSKGLTITQGRLSVYESSEGVRRLFCGQCGTPMAYEADRRSGEIHIFLGTLDQPENYTAQFHVFYKERLPWLTIHDDAKKHQTFP